MRHNFREMTIWKEGLEIARRTYRFTAELPDNEKFGLVSQMNRCSISIPSNIAEGSGRTSDKEFIHFLNISLSSTYELETQLPLCGDLFSADTNEIISKLQNLQKMIGGFKRTLT